MGAGNQALALGGEHVEGIGDLQPGVGRVDDGVEKPSLGGKIGVQEPGLVLGLERHPFLRSRPPVQDLDRPAGAHDRDLG